MVWKDFLEKKEKYLINIFLVFHIFYGKVYRKIFL